MKLNFIEEPELEFGNGHHVCPRAGITEHSVYDTRRKLRRDEVHLGAVGTSEGLASLAGWLERCSRFILPAPTPPDKTPHPNLFYPFYGFNPEGGFKASFVHGDELTRPLNNQSLRDVLKIGRWNERVMAAVDLYYTEAVYLARHRAVDVIVCVLPEELYELVSKGEPPTTDESIVDIQNAGESVDLEYNFRRLLKARAMHLNKPLQLVRENTLLGKAKDSKVTGSR